MEMSWVSSLCLSCWAGIGLYLLVLVLDRGVYTLFNAKKLGEKPEKFEEE